MEPCYLLKFDSQTEPQQEKDSSFIGGHPCIPEDQEIPKCQLCNNELTFFFQVAFPDNHSWHGLSMALFACTSCEHEGYSIPEMLEGPLLDIDIPKGFLESYQKNFRILIFNSQEGRLRTDYEEKVKFKRWELVPSQDGVDDNKIGGAPNWVLDDETPGTYNNKVPMTFLMQIMKDYEFEILPDAPPQFEYDIWGDPDPSDEPYYKLFLQNQLYFFGTEDRNEPLVYILTQID